MVVKIEIEIIRNEFSRAAGGFDYNIVKCFGQQFTGTLFLIFQIIFYGQAFFRILYTADGKTVQIIGGVRWNAKSWKQKRRVIGRKRFDPRTCQLDLRLIQTRIVNTTNFEHEGYAGELSKISCEDMYA